MSKIFRKTFSVNAMCVDSHGRAKPSFLLFMAQEAACRHCDALALSWEKMQEQELFWAIIRHKVQVTRLPLEGETVTVETWPMPTTRSAFPRATVAYDAQGRELFRTAALWVLMNTRTRAMVLPAKSGVALEGTVQGNELALPSSILPKVLENTSTRTVRYSELDRNKHMNNTRYLDWVDDLLPVAFHKDHPVREFTVCYLAEALEDQQIQLGWQLSDGPCLQVDGRRWRTDVPGEYDRVFSVQMTF